MVEEHAIVLFLVHPMNTISVLCCNRLTVLSAYSACLGYVNYAKPPLPMNTSSHCSPAFLSHNIFEAVIDQIDKILLSVITSVTPCITGETGEVGRKEARPPHVTHPGCSGEGKPHPNMDRVDFSVNCRKKVHYSIKRLME